jgi:hypothetical protein
METFVKRAWEEPRLAICAETIAAVPQNNAEDVRPGGRSGKTAFDDYRCRP